MGLFCVCVCVLEFISLKCCWGMARDCLVFSNEAEENTSWCKLGWQQCFGGVWLTIKFNTPQALVMMLQKTLKTHSKYKHLMLKTHPNIPAQNSQNHLNINEIKQNMPKQANLTKLLGRYYIKAKVSNNQYRLRCYQFIRDAPKWLFFHGFFAFFFPCSLFAIFSPLHKLNSQNVLFTVLSCFSNKKKSITKQQLKNIYLTLNFFNIISDITPKQHNLTYN